MNWYKRAQKIPTMENIIWAIDKLIAENYDFTVEELSQEYGEQSEQNYALPKAAQTTTKRKYVNRIDQKTEEDILDTTEKMNRGMQEDFSIKSINKSDIASILGVSVNTVRRIFLKNNIDLAKLKVERRDAIAQLIGQIAEDLDYNFTDPQMIKEFKQRHGYELTPATVYRAVKLNNLKTKNRNNPNNIYQSFTTYIDSMMNGGRKTLIRKDQEEPGTLSQYIDQFFQQYGEKNGFIPLNEQGVLKQKWLTKLQIRDNTQNMERNKYTPVDYSENNPATFIHDRKQNELV